MAAKKILFVLAVLLVLFGYWLYCPVPEGYSPESTRTLGIMLSTTKLMMHMCKLAETLGFGSSTGIQNAIGKFMVGLAGLREEDPDVKETDHVFDGVPVRIYEPAGRSGVLPGFVWIHGGGFVYGSIDMSADTTRRLCKQTNSIVISVDYRLAPEHVYPAAFEDSLAATKYLLTNADQFHVDPNRIAIGGESAGGNLAASVSIKLRDESFTPSIKLQVLVYPLVQSLNFQLPSIMKNANGPLLTRRMKAFFASMYMYGNDNMEEVFYNNDHVSAEVKKAGLPFIDLSVLPPEFLVGYVKPSVDSGNEAVWNQLKDRLLSPYYAPLIAASLSGLPPAYMFSAEHDPLRDENFMYVHRLRKSGVKVTHRHSDIGFHGIISLAMQMPEANDVLMDLTKFVSENL